MKKIIIALLLVVLSFSLASCDLGTTSSSSSVSSSSVTSSSSSEENSSSSVTSSTGQTVEITMYGGLDSKVAIKTGKVYDVLAGVEIWANTTNVTSTITYNIVDTLTGNAYTDISLDTSSTYTVTYTVTFEGNTYTKTREIIVGTGMAGSIVYDYDSLHYETKFTDNFDGNTLNSLYWNYEVGGGGWGNNELQYYTNGQNLTVADGFMNITVKKENYLNREYTSSRITTQDKVEFTYGKVSARIKVPSGKGVWSAFWMLGANISSVSWPMCGEIDIMENVGYDSLTTHSTIHTYAANGGNGEGSSIQISDPTTNFHVYTAEWLPDRIIFTVDDLVVYEAVAKSEDDLKIWPFKEEQFMIFNIAFGGNWGGAQGIDPNFVSSTMSVDYVTVEQATEFIPFV